MLNTLDSLFMQDYDDYEVICVDSSEDWLVADYAKEHDLFLVSLPNDTKHLRARYEAHLHSKGELSLLLDSTRPLKRNALRELADKFCSYDMTIIKEDSIGQGFWVNQSRKIKVISERQLIQIQNVTPAFLLPRLYNSILLTAAFKDVKSLAGHLFSEISYGEHHLIFESCRKYSQNVGITTESLLSHYEDNTLMKIIRKYHWYGKSQRILNTLEKTDASKLSSHIRKDVNLSDRVCTLPLTVARGIPFMLGYLLF